MPEAWDEFTPDELAPALAVSRWAADDTLDLSWNLEVKLPGTRAAFRSGIVPEYKARIIATATALLDPEEARAYAESIVHTVRESLVILTHYLRVNSANQAFYDRFQTSAGEVVGRPFPEINGGVWAIPELLTALTTIVPEHAELKDFEVRHDFGPLGAKVMLLNARKLFRVGNGTTMMLLAIDDIT